MPWMKERQLNERLLNARRRSEASRLNNEYKEKHKEVRQRVKEDKILYVDELTKEVENAAEKHMKELYNITRVLSGKKIVAEKPVKDKNGNIQTTTEE
jgi:hypothetical protein